MRSAVAIALTVLATAGTTAAQPVLAPPALSPPGAVSPSPAAALPPPPQADEVSESAALMIAVGGTAASYGMVVFGARMEGEGSSGARRTIVGIGALGTLIAPSAGRWYAGSGGLRGLGLRIGGLGTAVLAVAALLGECGLFSGESCHPGGAVVLGVAATGLYLAGTIDDIVMAPRDARRHNERPHHVTVVPLVRPDDHGFGLAAAARF